MGQRHHIVPAAAGEEVAISRQAVDQPEAGEAVLARALGHVGLRSGAFIVTLYGDVVEPRGGRLAMADIVETCQAVGISETLVRTVVSRLVAAGQLTGIRQGRRSFYSLTEAASREYASAARVLFGGDDARRWCFVWVGLDRPEDAVAALVQAGFARVGPQWYFGPASDGVAAGRAAFACDATVTGTDLRAVVGAYWDLSAIEARYSDFVATFQPIAWALPAAHLTDAQALHMRLLAIHAYRLAVLGDVRLPADALPEGWSGHRARALFAALYLQLSPAADRHIARRFESGDGPLPERTRMTVHRLSTLQAVGPA